jgi:hypothetical protein
MDAKRPVAVTPRQASSTAASAYFTAGDMKEVHTSKNRVLQRWHMRCFPSGLSLQRSLDDVSPMKAIIVRRTFIGYLVAASLLIGGEAAASVIYRLSGTVVEADEAALPNIGNHVSVFLELSDRAFALSPPLYPPTCILMFKT